MQHGRQCFLGYQLLQWKTVLHLSHRVAGMADPDRLHLGRLCPHVHRRYAGNQVAREAEKPMDGDSQGQRSNSILRVFALELLVLDNRETNFLATRSPFCAADDICLGLESGALQLLLVQHFRMVTLRQVQSKALCLPRVINPAKP